MAVIRDGSNTQENIDNQLGSGLDLESDREWMMKTFNSGEWRLKKDQMSGETKKSAVAMPDISSHKRMWNIKEINTCKNMPLGIRTYRYIYQVMWRNRLTMSFLSCCRTIFVHCKCALLSLLVKVWLADNWVGRDWVTLPETERSLGGRRVEPWESPTR